MKPLRVEDVYFTKKLQTENFLKNIISSFSFNQIFILIFISISYFIHQMNDSLDALTVLNFQLENTQALNTNNYFFRKFVTCYTIVGGLTLYNSQKTKILRLI